MKWFWGILFIATGIFFLGKNIGIFEGVDWAAVWTFWPLLLILFGLSIFVRRWKFGWIVMVLAFMASAAFVFAATYYDLNKVSTKDEIKKSLISEDLPSDATRGEIFIESGAVDLNLTSGGDKFIEGSLDSNISEPQISSEISGTAITSTVKTDPNIRVWGDFKNNLDLRITEKIPVEVNVEAGASKLDLDFSNVILSELVINAGASSIDAKIGSKIADNTNITVDAGASSIKFAFPKELGILVMTESSLSSRDFDGFKKISKKEYRSDNYDDSTRKITLTINAGISSIELERN